MALHQYIADEIALDCADGLLTRREAMRRLGLLGFTVTSAAALLAACGSDDDSAASTASGRVATTTGAGSTLPDGTTSTGPPASNHPSTTAAGTTTTGAASPATGTEIRFTGPNGELIGQLAEAASPKGAVLVIHENRGLTAHIRTIPGRLAADGYTALAIDLLSEEGGTAALPSEGDATAALGNAPAERLIADLRAGLDELVRRAPGAKLAVIGFCFGGGLTWQLLAAGEPRLAAAVPFYGPFPDGADLSGSPDAAVAAMYGALDQRVDATQPAAEAALAAAGLVHEMHVFEGADHAFFNDTGPRYNATAATEAYRLMLEWFAAHLA